MTPDPVSESVAVCFSSDEKRRLEQLAGGFGQTLAEYIRERALAEYGCEEQVLRLLFDELAAAARSAQVADLNASAHDAPEQPAETPQAQRERIMKEVRASLTEAEIEALRWFFKPVFDKGLGPDAMPQEKEVGP